MKLLGNIQQFVYGSTPWSSGYSILAKSQNFEEKWNDPLIQYCEKYDAQSYATPFFTYNISIFHKLEAHIFTEIFGGWRDQVGRPSKVIRNTIIDSDAWELLGANPFLMLWMLPGIRSAIPKKRNEMKEIPAIDIAKLDQQTWKYLWYRETKKVLKILSNLSDVEKKWICYLQTQQDPFLARDISTEEGCVSLCRALLYAIPKNKRNSIHLDSFSLNAQKAQGLCFRYSLYSSQTITLPSINTLMDGNSNPDLEWMIATIIHSVPEPHNAFVLKMLYQKQKMFFFLASLLTFGISIAIIAYLILK